MNKYLFCVALVLTFVPLGVSSQVSAWKQIRPGESTISEVERIFGSPRERDHYIRYETEEGVYFVSFSDGKCVTKWKEAWNSDIGGLPPLKEGTPLLDWDLPEWTVIRVHHIPSRSATSTDLAIDLEKLQKTKRTSDTTTYTDKEEGISYQVRSESKRGVGTVRRIHVVTGITLVPAVRHSSLVCRAGK